MQLTRVSKTTERVPTIFCLQHLCTGNQILSSKKVIVQKYKLGAQTLWCKNVTRGISKKPNFGGNDDLRKPLDRYIWRPRASADNGEGTSVETQVDFPGDYSELLKQGRMPSNLMGVYHDANIWHLRQYTNYVLGYIISLYSVKQVKVATQLALKDSKHLLEIEFPTAGLESVSGDAEGGIEMNSNMAFIREFCGLFFKPEQATCTRIFFPEAKEAEFAKQTVFEGVSFKMDYLTKPSLFKDFGFGTKVKVADHVQARDVFFLVAYPYFNVDEMLVVEELYKDAVVNTERKLIIFNGELDRIRSGYYPSFFYPKLAALAKNFLPKLETAYYIHNFKGQEGGTLFRSYPGPWKVLRKVDGKYACLHQQETMPSLKDVALNILPST